jgi:hypothetical protein
MCARYNLSMHVLDLRPSGATSHACRHPAIALPALPCSHPPSDKIVSLSPGATEMLWALGLGARVAAVSDVCDFPPDVVARAKARRSFAIPNAASFSSLLDRHGGNGSASGGTSSGTSRRESPTYGAQATPGDHRRTASGVFQLAGATGDAGSQLQTAVDEEVLARERPGLVIYEEDASAEGDGGGGGMMGGGGGMAQAVLEALVAVGLQQSCRVACVRRRTLSDILDSMLVVSGECWAASLMLAVGGSVSCILRNSAAVVSCLVAASQCIAEP